MQGRIDRRADRLGRIFDAVRALIAEFQPHEVAIEQQYVNENVRSAMVVGEARAAVMVAASVSGIPVFEFPPASVKESVTGWGGAPKEQVARMVLVAIGRTEIDGPAVVFTNIKDYPGQSIFVNPISTWRRDSVSHSSAPTPTPSTKSASMPMP